MIKQFQKFKEMISKKFLILLVINLVVSFVINLFLVYLLIIQVPTTELIYRDWGAELPFLSRGIFTLSNFFIGYWYLILPLIGLLQLILSAVVSYVGQKLDIVKLVVIYLGLFIFGSLGVIICLFLTIYLPLYSIAI